MFIVDCYNDYGLTGFATSTKAQILCGGCWTQAYENRLFFLKAAGAGDVAVSAEDALIAQHASAALKRRESSSSKHGNKEASVEVLDRRARNKGITSAEVSTSSRCIFK